MVNIRLSGDLKIEVLIQEAKEKEKVSDIVPCSISQRNKENMSLLDQRGYLTLAAFVIFLNYVIYASILYQQVKKYIMVGYKRMVRRRVESECVDE